jgi:hypothetical protein
MPRKVTVDDMVGAVEELGRPCTKQDIADRTGVSRQTIANHADELESDDRIRSGKVGTAKAYWLPPEPQDDNNAGDSGESEEVNLSLPKNEALSNWSKRLKRLSVALGFVALLPAIAVFALSPGGVGALGVVNATLAMAGLAVIAVLSVVVLAFAKLFEEVSKIAVSPTQTATTDGDTA